MYELLPESLPNVYWIMALMYTEMYELLYIIAQCILNYGPMYTESLPNVHWIIVIFVHL